MKYNMERTTEQDGYKRLVEKTRLHGKLIKELLNFKLKSLSSLNDSLIHVAFLLYWCKAKKCTLPQDKREKDPGVFIKLDDVVYIMETYTDHQFNHSWFGTDKLVDLKAIAIRKKEIDDIYEINENSKQLFYILLQLFIVNPKCDESLGLNEEEQQINEQLIQLIYCGDLLKMFPRYFAPHLNLKPDNTDLLSSGHLSIESILLNWINAIIKKQISEYDQYIVCNNAKDAKFEKISWRVRESISLERRRAVVGVKKDKKESKEEDKSGDKNNKQEQPTIHPRFEILFDHSKCTSKVKACARWKELHQRKIELQKPKVSKKVEEMIALENNLDLIDSRVKRHKNDDYVVHNGTLYLKFSWFKQLQSLEDICQKDYSRFLLVLSVLMPEYFIDFQQTWVNSKISDLNYEDLVLLREDIEMWHKKTKVNLLMKIIHKLGYKVFEEEFKYESDSSDSDDDEEHKEEVYERHLKLLNKNKVFYFPLLYKLFKSNYNNLNLGNKVSMII